MVLLNPRFRFALTIHREKKMNKKVLLLVDIPNWALDKNAKDIVKYNISNLIFEICYSDEFFNNWEKYYQSFDLIHAMYMGLFFRCLKNKIPVDKITTGIRSFHRWDRKKASIPPGYNVRPPRKIIRRLKKALLVNTQSKKLWYNFIHYFPVIHTKYACDLETFYPEKKPHHKKIVVGWAGSLENHPGKRGFHEFIKPICDEVSEIELKVQAKEDNFITDDDRMREFYNSLDIYICASRCEGGPRPALESAACGVPVISTDVGLIPELIDDGVNGFIVDRNYEAIKQGLLKVVSLRDRLSDIGRLLREKVEREFNWNAIIIQWTDFFSYAIELKRLKGAGEKVSR